MKVQNELLDEEVAAQTGRIFTKRATDQLIAFMDELLCGETDIYHAAIKKAGWGEYLQANVNKEARRRIGGQILKNETCGDVGDWLRLVHDLVERNGHGGSPLKKGIVLQ